MADFRDLASAERRDLLALARDLDDAEWEAPSLCEHWSVREVVAHVLSYDERSRLGTAALFLRGGMRPGRVNDLALRDYEEHSPAELVALLERCEVPRGLPAAMGAGIALADGLIHQQDVRRPLGRQRAVPADRLRAVLDIALTAPTLPARSLRRGLRLEATDLDWAAGDGELVQGPGESVLMAVAGRADALPELSGPGALVLAGRVGS
jgi:uncharacterized protein (TIGR03083 family)